MKNGAEPNKITQFVHNVRMVANQHSQKDSNLHLRQQTDREPFDLSRSVMYQYAGHDVKLSPQAS